MKLRLLPAASLSLIAGAFLSAPISAQGAEGPTPDTDGANLVVDGLIGNSPVAITASDIWSKVTAGSASLGTINQSAGTLNVTSELLAGTNNAADGVYNLTGGAITTVSLTLGRNSFANGFFARGPINQSAGTISATGNGAVNIGLGGIGIVSLSGGTFDTSASLNPLTLASLAGSTGVFHLNGGTLKPASVLGGAGASTFQFNGGTLQAGASSTTFFQSLGRANVRNGGARINTNGFNATIAQVLAHSNAAGDAAIDVGLTKSGAGTLILGGANTYTGPTLLNAGTAQLLASGTLGSGGGITNASGSTLDLTPFGAGGFPLASGRTLTNNGSILGTLQVSGRLQGFGAIDGLVVNAGGLVANTGAGTATVTGAVTNNGTIRFAGGAVLNAAGATSFVNNGILDLLTAGPGTTLPPNLVHGAGGLVLTASSVKVKSLTRTGGTVSVDIDSYDGHVYALQRSSDLTAGFTTLAAVPAQPGATGSTLTFTDNAAPAGEVFYRVPLNP